MKKLNRPKNKATIVSKDGKNVGERYELADKVNVEEYSVENLPRERFIETVKNKVERTGRSGIFVCFDDNSRAIGVAFNVDGEYVFRTAEAVGNIVVSSPMAQLCDLEEYGLAAEVIDKAMTAFEDGMSDAVPEGDGKYISSCMERLLEKHMEREHKKNSKKDSKKDGKD